MSDGIKILKGKVHIMKTIEQFWNEITASTELAEKFAKAANEQQLEAFLKENEVSGTAEQFNDFLREQSKASGELSDEKLEAVSGGCFIAADNKSVNVGTRIVHLRSNAMYIVEKCFENSDSKLYYIKQVDTKLVETGKNAPEMPTILNDQEMEEILNSNEYFVRF